MKTHKAELEQFILALAMPYQQEINLILTVPSFKNIFSAITVLSEIGTNMEAFPSAKHIFSWASLTPTNNESAGKKNQYRFPMPDVILSHFLSNALMPWSEAKNILKFVTAICV